MRKYNKITCLKYLNSIQKLDLMDKKLRNWNDKKEIKH